MSAQEFAHAAARPRRNISKNNLDSVRINLDENIINDSIPPPACITPPRVNRKPVCPNQKKIYKEAVERRRFFCTYNDECNEKLFTDFAQTD